MKLDGLTHLGFALFEGVSGRDHAWQVRRVSAVVGGTIAGDHDRILAHDSPLPCISLASIFVQPSLPPAASAPNYLLSERCSYLYPGEIPDPGSAAGLRRQPAA